MNKSKNDSIENELKKLKTLDSSYFKGKSNFEEDGTENYLVSQPMYQYLKKIGNSDNILSWKSKGLSDDTIKPPSTCDNSLSPSVDYLGVKRRVELTVRCLKQDKTTYNQYKYSKYLRCL